jgi:hypothetical protein
LTSQGNHALHCVKTAILLSGNPSSWVGVPLSVVLNGLSMLAPPTGCDGIVNMNGFSQLGNIGSLNSHTCYHQNVSTTLQHQIYHIDYIVIF